MDLNYCWSFSLPFFLIEIIFRWFFLFAIFSFFLYKVGIPREMDDCERSTTQAINSKGFRNRRRTRLVRRLWNNP